jgi:leucyl aminopeptidase
VEFSTKRSAPEKRATPCIAVGVYAGRKLSAAAETLDRASGGSLAEILRRGDMEGRLGATLLLYRVPGIAAERVLLVGLGAEADLHEREYRDAARAAVKAAQETGAGSATLCFTEIRAGRRDAAWKARQVA